MIAVVPEGRCPLAIADWYLQTSGTRY